MTQTYLPTVLDQQVVHQLPTDPATNTDPPQQCSQTQGPRTPLFDIAPIYLLLQAYHTYLAQMYLQTVLDQQDMQQQPSDDAASAEAPQQHMQQRPLRGGSGSAALPPQAVDAQNNAYAKLKHLVRLTRRTTVQEVLKRH